MNGSDAKHPIGKSALRSPRTRQRDVSNGIPTNTPGGDECWNHRVWHSVQRDLSSRESTRDLFHIHPGNLIHYAEAQRRENLCPWCYGPGHNHFVPYPPDMQSFIGKSHASPLGLESRQTPARIKTGKLVSRRLDKMAFNIQGSSRMI